MFFMSNQTKNIGKLCTIWRVKESTASKNIFDKAPNRRHWCRMDEKPRPLSAYIMNLATERKPLTEFTEKAYLDYSMYVILDRALPHIADGFKTVQRRIV